MVITISDVVPLSVISDRNAIVSTSVIIVLRRVFAYPTTVGSITNRITFGFSFTTFLKMEPVGGLGAARDFRLAFAARISAIVFGAAGTSF